MLPAAVAAAWLASGCDGLTVYISTQPSAVGPPVGAVWVAFEMDGVGVKGNPQDLVFENDRRVAGSSGCNRYSAVFDATPAVRIGPVTTTRRACEPPIMEHERRFIDAIQSTATYRVDGDTMEFGDTMGRTRLRFRRAPAELDGKDP
jgi:putative lipoprotein